MVAPRLRVLMLMRLLVRLLSLALFGLRTVISLAISQHWPVYQLDVKNVFLHGDLAETVYTHQPPGFRDPEHPDYVCLLQRSLYGLKQAPRAWFQRFAAYITTVGFVSSRCDSSLFIYRQGDDTAFLLLYVDDIVLTASSDRLLQQIIAWLFLNIGLFISLMSRMPFYMRSLYGLKQAPRAWFQRFATHTSLLLGLSRVDVTHLCLSTDRVMI
ncbi:ribonuclease H-like domain-containing protein [Tanacetum coccineum]